MTVTHSVTTLIYPWLYTLGKTLVLKLTDNGVFVTINVFIYERRPHDFSSTILRPSNSFFASFWDKFISEMSNSLRV